jgi:hypothetical protein
VTRANDDEDEDVHAQLAQVDELIRRMRALDAGHAQVVDIEEVRARVMARLRSIRGRE